MINVVPPNPRRNNALLAVNNLLNPPMNPQNEMIDPPMNMNNLQMNNIIPPNPGVKKIRVLILENNSLYHCHGL